MGRLSTTECTYLPTYPGYFTIHTKVHIGFWEYRCGFSKGYYKQCHRGTSRL